MLQKFIEAHSPNCLLSEKCKFISPFQSTCSALLENSATEIGKKGREDFREYIWDNPIPLQTVQDFDDSRTENLDFKVIVST